MRHVGPAGVGPAGVGGHRLDRAEAGPQQRDHMRRQVPQRALISPPRRVKRAAAAERRSEPDRVPAGPAAGVHDVSQPGPDVRLEARGEEDDGRDAGVLDGAHECLAAGIGQGDGLFQQQVLARARGPHGDGGLHVGRHAEGNPVDVGQEGVEIVMRRGVVLAGQCSRGLGVAAPDGGELDAVGRGERGRVRDARPVAGAGQAEPQRPRGSCHP